MGRRPRCKVEDMPPTIKLTSRTRHAPNSKSTKNTEQNHMPNIAYSKRLWPKPLSEVEDMPRTTKLTNRTRHAPTQNTKQNHMPIKKEGGRRPPSKIQDMHPTTKLSKNTRLAPIDK